jgi:SOS-response transcriptional repressor LexA
LIVDMRWPLALIKARQVRGLSQSDAGRAMGISQVSYGNRERGVTEIGEEWLAQFLDKINMKRAEFDAIVQRVPVQSVTPSEDIPLYPSLASAGKRAFMPEDTGEEWTEKVPRGTATKHPRAFAARVRGDSMEPKVSDGDVLVCEPIDDEEGLESLQDGRVVVAIGVAPEVRDVDIVNGEPRRATPLPVPTGGMVGVWAWVGGGEAELRKTNKAYQPIRLPARHNGTVRIAVVVELRRPM